MLSLTDSDHIPHEYKIHKALTELIYQALYSLNHKEFNSMKVFFFFFPEQAFPRLLKIQSYPVH